MYVQKLTDDCFLFYIRELQFEHRKARLFLLFFSLIYKAYLF